MTQYAVILKKLKSWQMEDLYMQDFEGNSNADIKILDKMKLKWHFLIVLDSASKYVGL